MSRPPARGKRRAEPPKKRRRPKEPKPKGGKRADRPGDHEGLTPEFLQQLRELELDDAEAEVEAPRVQIFPGGVGVREVLAGIDGELRADQEYLQALGRLAYG
jgi:hypothetical protein